MNVDRVVFEDKKVVISIDKTKYKSSDVEVLNKLYPSGYKTLELQEVNDDEGYINYCFSNHNTREFDISKFTVLDKLIILYSIFEYERFFTKNYQTSLCDENIVLDKANNIVVIFIERVDVYKFDYEINDSFLRQAKARILSEFTKYSYDEILKSDFSLAFKTKFEKSILEVDDVESLRDLMASYIDDNKESQNKNFVYVKKNNYIAFRMMSFISIILLIVLVSYGAIFYNSDYEELVFNNNLYSEFVGKNYSNVIASSKDEQLSPDQKYLVGYSAIQTTSLSQDKKNVILSGYDLNVSETIHDYWIAIGYGKYEEAVNKGKALNNNEYVLYALRLEEVRLLNNDTMDGTEKVQKLEQVQSEIIEYEELLGLNSTINEVTNNEQ